MLRLARAAQRVAPFSPLRTAPYYMAVSDAVPPALRITAIPLFSDNYAWRVDNLLRNESFVIDPADAPAVLSTYEAADAPDLVAILCTHHHKDHAGGNADMLAAHPRLTVVASSEEGDRVHGVTQRVRDGDVITLAGVEIQVLHTPCHTRGHVCYFTRSDPSRPPLVFTGDTLFAAGCGRFFEGDAATMHASLAKLTALPHDTQVFCGHEYTAANLRFCAHVEPHNADTAARITAVDALRRAGAPSVPSTLADELRTNVFLRTSSPAVRAFTHGDAAATVDDVDVLSRLREAKNAFK